MRGKKAKKIRKEALVLSNEIGISPRRVKRRIKNIKGDLSVKREALLSNSVPKLYVENLER